MLLSELAICDQVRPKSNVYFDGCFLSMYSEIYLVATGAGAVLKSIAVGDVCGSGMTYAACRILRSCA